MSNRDETPYIMQFAMQFINWKCPLQMNSFIAFNNIYTIYLLINSIKLHRQTEFLTW